MELKSIFRAILALALITQPTMAEAQSFPKPPDVVAYVPVAPLYKTDGTQNTPIDPTVTPPSAVELTEVNPIASPPSTMIETGSYGNGPSGVCTIDGLTCQEAKFRTEANTSHILLDDPIRNYGQPGTSHCHQFFGNLNVNAYSTYASIRNKSNSAAAGGNLNGTAYWFPCPIKTNPFGDGKNYSIKMNFVSIYYVDDPTQSIIDSHLYRGLRYVFGANMDDPSYSELQTILTNANAAQGHSRYFLAAGAGYAVGNVSDRGYWTCFHGGPDTGTAVPAYSDATTPTGGTLSGQLKNSDGSDPFHGACVSGDTIEMQIQGPSCWDGKNLWSPGGYKNVIPLIWDQDYGKYVCPYNYYRIPDLTLLMQFPTTGAADYMNWRLSSDDHYGVLKTGSASSALNGESFHTDWMFGWDNATILKWEQNCLGVEHHTPHQCNSSLISTTEMLNFNNAGPQGRSPQVNGTLYYTPSSASNMFLVPTSSTGPKNIIMHP